MSDFCLKEGFNCKYCEEGECVFYSMGSGQMIDMPCFEYDEESINVLDKIRAEIDQKQYDFMGNKDYDEGIRFGLMLAYQIIDKYKEESEEE